jgi:hypothetical protein
VHSALPPPNALQLATNLVASAGWGSFAVIPGTCSPRPFSFSRSRLRRVQLILDLHRDVFDWSSFTCLPYPTPRTRVGQALSYQSRNARLAISPLAISNFSLLSADTRLPSSHAISCYATSAYNLSARPAPDQYHRYHQFHVP